MKFKDDQLTRNLDHLMARLQQRRSSVRIFSFAESAKPLGYIEQSQLTRSDASIGELTSPITATCGMRQNRRKPSMPIQPGTPAPLGFPRPRRLKPASWFELG
jgi:hypothetical protein